MITVNIFKQGNYPIDAKKLKAVVAKTLADNGIVSDTAVDVAFVGSAKIEELNKNYYKDKVYEHPIFTFPETEGGEFIFPPDGILHLGEIVISYPAILEEAKEKGKLIDDVACDLAIHGSLHLVGIHHT